MNPGLKLFLILIISLEISLIPNLIANIIIIVASLSYLTFKHLSLKKLLLIFLIPLFAALVVFITIYYFTPAIASTKPASYLREFTLIYF